jgi:hypothetical protein
MMGINIDIMACPAIDRGHMIAMNDGYPVYVGPVLMLPPGLDWDRVFMNPLDVAMVRNAARELGLVDA